MLHDCGAGLCFARPPVLCNVNRPPACLCLLACLRVCVYICVRFCPLCCRNTAGLWCSNHLTIFGGLPNLFACSVVNVRHPVRITTPRKISAVFLGLCGLLSRVQNNCTQPRPFCYSGEIKPTPRKNKNNLLCGSTFGGSLLLCWWCYLVALALLFFCVCLPVPCLSKVGGGCACACGVCAWLCSTARPPFWGLLLCGCFLAIPLQNGCNLWRVVWCYKKQRPPPLVV